MGPPLEPCSEDPRIASFEQLAEGAGWTVQRGAFAFPELGDCCVATVHRAAVFDDPAAGAAYRADPGLVVLRLTPELPRPSLAPRVDPGRPVLLSGADESAWQPSLDALDDALVAAWPGWTVERQGWTRAGASPDPCLAEGRPCGDLLFRFFVRTGLFDLPSDGSFAVAIGVNHERSGRATYSSFSTQAWAHHVGIDAVASPQMPGSAPHLLPADPLADDLFVVYMAQDCSLFPDGICLEVPTGCPGGLRDRRDVRRLAAVRGPGHRLGPRPDRARRRPRAGVPTLTQLCAVTCPPGQRVS